MNNFHNINNLAQTNYKVGQYDTLIKDIISPQKQIKSGILLFVKDYTIPLYDYNNQPVYSIHSNSMRTLKYNIMLIDDKYINQFGYSHSSNKEQINIKLLKSTHINKLEKVINLNLHNDYLVINNL